MAWFAVSAEATETSLSAGVIKSFTGETRNAADSSSFAAAALCIENYIFTTMTQLDIELNRME